MTTVEALENMKNYYLVGVNQHNLTNAKFNDIVTIQHYGRMISWLENTTKIQSNL